MDTCHAAGSWDYFLGFFLPGNTLARQDGEPCDVTSLSLRLQGGICERFQFDYSLTGGAGAGAGAAATVGSGSFAGDGQAGTSGK